MERSDFQYDLLFDLSPDLLCIAGYDGYFKKVNPAVSKTLGYSMEELYAKPINDFVHPDHKDVTARARDELTRSKPLYHFENKYLTKAGETVWLSWTSFPLPGEKVIFAIAKNVTHKKKLEVDRNALLTSLTAKNKDLLEMTFSTTSDLRTGVHGLLALFDLVDTRRITDVETLRLLEVIQYAAEKVRRILDDHVGLLSERDKQDIVREETNLQQCLDRAMQSMNAMVETSGTTLVADFSRVATVIFNKGCMESIFLNLITNAIKFASPDRKPVISIHSERVGQRNQLVISDNGSGFDATAFKRELLGRVNRLAANQGIGLYLIHNQVEALGGEVEIESKVNEGTKVVIRF